jgi:hypothetical protein
MIKLKGQAREIDMHADHADVARLEASLSLRDDQWTGVLIEAQNPHTKAEGGEMYVLFRTSQAGHFSRT